VFFDLKKQKIFLIKDLKTKMVQLFIIFIYKNNNILIKFWKYNIIKKNNKLLVYLYRK
jgi:hypothetical protein